MKTEQVVRAISSVFSDFQPLSVIINDLTLGDNLTYTQQTVVQRVLLD